MRASGRWEAKTDEVVLEVVVRASGRWEAKTGEVVLGVVAKRPLQHSSADDTASWTMDSIHVISINTTARYRVLCCTSIIYIDARITGKTWGVAVLRGCFN